MSTTLRWSPASLPSVARWQPSPAARLIGDLSRTVYEPPSVYQTGQPTQLSPGTGTVAFRDWVLARFPGFTSGGTRRSPAKPETPGRQRDAHEEGIAVDFMVRDGGRGGAEGTALAEWLLANHEAIGLQGLIWTGTSWYPARAAPKVRDYTGSHFHDDHLHVELSSEAARLSREAMAARVDRVYATSLAPSGGTGSTALGTAVKVGVGGAVVAACVLLGRWLAGRKHRR